MIRKEKLKVICFGEVLWDNLPSGRKPGGAVMNVAYHLKNLGLDAELISRVGDDADGEALLAELVKLNLGIDYCQKDRMYKTSTVQVEVSNDHEMKYDIVYPVAWDYIEFQDRFADLVYAADALVFGSLSGRNETSRNTLYQLLEQSKYKVMDVNLRIPYYNESYVSNLLGKTDLLKLNLEELGILTDWYSKNCRTESDRVTFLQDKFGIAEILVTKGANGATYHGNKEEYHWSAYNIEVNDTVGSGDSFLAAFLSKRLIEDNIQEALDFAAALSAFVTTQKGACPPYQRATINRFMINEHLKT